MSEPSTPLARLNAWKEVADEIERARELMPGTFEDMFPDWFWPRVLELREAASPPLTSDEKVLEQIGAAMRRIMATRADGLLVALSHEALTELVAAAAVRLTKQALDQLRASTPPTSRLPMIAIAMDAPMKNGIRFGERVCCVDVPRLHGTVLRCDGQGVDVRWDDGTLGELVWNEGVAYNAYRLHIVRASTPPTDPPTKT